MARRPKGEGTYEQRGGKYRHIRTQDGKRQTGPWEPSKRDALNSWQLRFMAPADGRNDAGNLPIRNLVSSLFTVGETAIPSHPISKRLASRWSPSTLEAWRCHLNSIAAQRIGSYSLDQLTPEVLQAWVATMRPRTGKNYYEDLRMLAREAGVQLAPVRFARRQAKEMPVVLPAEFPALLKLCGSDSLRLTVGLLYFGGFRLSELAALKRDAWNSETSELTVLRSATEAKGKLTVREATKTGKPRRVPIVAPWLAEMVESSPPGYLIHAGDPSRPLTPGAIRQRIHQVLTGTKFARITPQGFRRSAATAYALSGVQIHVAAQILGHSVRMLTEIYAQYNPEARSSAARQAFGIE